jgi:hypothetical protein
VSGLQSNPINTSLSLLPIHVNSMDQSHAMRLHVCSSPIHSRLCLYSSPSGMPSLFQPLHFVKMAYDGAVCESG